ncbi:extracellular solute-binding protein [Amycolatopsis acidicola]|uniref:Extracellular solute-binding protein n=1 Tax=Amycolatopsis acidicola TaxID=2596893 RepID=A0A5N0V4K2_9PSEU|nr:extracellular solute-binding protein [Amycolatopsis acidicola]KAA9160081.1 extracellular solute-binding protein [Amycolatopsis acidicola]
MNRPAAKKNPRRALAACLTAVLALTACGPGGDDSGAQVDISGVTAPVLDKLTGAEHDRVARLIAQARGENELSWIDSVVAPTTATAMFAAFQQQYGLPGAKLTFERLTSGQLSSRLEQEVSAGQGKTDFFGVASPRLLSELADGNGLTQYDSPESVHYTAASKYVAQKPGYYIAPVAYAFAVVVNPGKYAKPVTSWADLADPALKGKWDVPNVSANEGSLYWYYGLRGKLDPSVFRDWAANGPLTSTGSSAEEAQKVAQGQVSVSVTSGFRVSQTVAQTKVPLKVYYPQEGTPLAGQTYAITSTAPHAAIAKLFDDWLLSEAGQRMYVEKEGIGSFYPGVDPPASAAPYQPAFSDMPIIPLNTDQVATSELDKARTEWKGLFSR